jgi:heptosyltransferase I
MKVLIIKMSSLGDVLHTLPALTDAGNAIDDIEFHWVVEKAFEALPHWHPRVTKVIPLAFRTLRKTPVRSLMGTTWRRFVKTLRAEKYDLVIDAQGLIKSALITRIARGTKAGLDKGSLREPLARFAYQKHYAVDPTLHAVTRVRQLFAGALNYAMPETPADYGLHREAFKNKSTIQTDFVLFLHGTTWSSKCWPENYWIALADLVKREGLDVYLSWGNKEEKARAQRIADASQAQVLPRMRLENIVNLVAAAKAIVSVDTGLGHIAAALSVPTVSLYGPTDANRTGMMGENQVHLAADFPCSPCFQRECNYAKPSAEKPACYTTVKPDAVLKALRSLNDTH